MVKKAKRQQLRRGGEAASDMTATNVERGSDFEAAVQSLYEGLGFIVERNVRVGGQQVDLIIRRSLAGVGTLKFLVECKFLSSGSLPNQEVQNFVAFFRSVKGSDGITGAILVCSRDFSVDAKCSADAEDGVQLKRLVDLQKELFDVADLLRYAVHSFEQSETFNQYVPLTGTLFKGGNECKVADVVEYLSEWAAVAQGGLITILGDFGSGKTTLLLRLNYVLAKSVVLSQTIPRIPILFFLRDRQNYRSVEDYVEATALKQFQTKIPLESFWKELRTGKFIIILDGFDEISTKVSVDRRAKLFYDLAPLITTLSPAVMSCRPSYFVSKAEFRTLMVNFESHSRGLLGFERTSFEISDKLMQKYTEKPEYLKLTQTPTDHIVLEAFDNKRIDTYLQNRQAEFPVSWQSVKTFLLSIYDLRDLMARPILLSMIADTVIDGKIDVTKETSIIGPAGLYELYTSLQFRRDTYKGKERRFLSSDQRRYFAHAAALAMLENQSLAVSYKQIMDIIAIGLKEARSLTLPTDASPEEIGTDVLTCAFLTLASDDMFRFTHRSFMEFFLAQYFRIGLMEALGRSDVRAGIDLLNRSLPNEVLAFLGHYSKIDTNLWAYCQAIVDQFRSGQFSETLALVNANAILLFIGAREREISLWGGDFRDVPFSKVKWVGHSFNVCKFAGFRLTESTIENCIFGSCSVSESEIADARITDSHIDGELTDTVFSSIDISNVNLISNARNVYFKDSTLVNLSAKLKGDLEVVGSTLIKFDVEAVGDLKLRFVDTKLDGVTVGTVGPIGSSKSRQGHEPLVYLLLSDCVFAELFLMDVWISDEESFKALTTNANGRIQGFVNVRLSPELLIKYHVKPSGQVKKLGPGLIAVLHGKQRCPLEQLQAGIDLINQSSEADTFGRSPQERLYWERHLLWLRGKDTVLRDLI